MNDTFFPTILDNVFDELFINKSTLYPKVNVKEKETEFEIIAATPGLDKKDISIEISDGVLNIKGESKQEENKQNEKFLCKELKKSSFIRSFKVDDSLLNFKDIKSTYNNGELKITIPKNKYKDKNNSIKISIE